VKILLLEDEYSLAQSIKEFLSEYGYRVSIEDNSNNALSNIYENQYDLLLFDINVFGEMNGIKLLEVIRKEYEIKTPTIFITALNDIDSLKSAFNLGCCDYIRKPFDMVELELRIKQSIRANCFFSDDDKVELGKGYIYNIKNYTIIKDDLEIQLNNKEKNILELLVRNRDKFLSVDNIRDTIWGDKDIDIANIRVQINNLRKKIDGDLIINIRGLGYKIEN